MGLTIKVPIKEVEKTEPVIEKLEKFLKNDKENAYTIGGLMITAFGVKESQIRGKSFGQWDPGLPTLFTQVRLSLVKLVREGKLKQKKSGRAMVYWWVENKK